MSSQAPPVLPHCDATTTSDLEIDFVETLEHRRFVEFCNSCRRSKYIGLCYGPPGTGKTLSARRYGRAELIRRRERWGYEPIYGLPLDTAFYTPDVMNTPAQILTDIQRSRSLLSHLARGPLYKQEEITLETIRLRDEHYYRTHRNEPGYKPSEPSPLEPTFHQVAEEYARKRRAIGDPTTLILIDEADRLRMHSIEQLRAIFDEGGFGLIFIGMPGIEKRLATRNSIPESASSMNSGLSAPTRCRAFSTATGRPPVSSCPSSRWRKKPRRP
jgi:hypothetical protein